VVGISVAEAIRLSARLNIEFKASNGWLRNFLRRNDLVVRRVTLNGRVLQHKNLPNIKSK
jgi:hypothetical protein